MTQRMLVAWFQFSRNGSIARFLEVARRLGAFGHCVEFVSLTGETTCDWADVSGRIRTLAELEGETFDAVMVPGAGNANDPLEKLAVLRDDRFGLRVQHVLNDPSRLDRFAKVNEILRPHRVVFNNSHWTPRDYRTLRAESFHTLAGAVDTKRFSPTPLRTFPREANTWTIGAFAAKNLTPVLEAMERLPGNVRLATCGEIAPGDAASASSLAANGRLVPWGHVYGHKYRSFYDAVDLVVTTETSAGWCNVAAEAMACGVPVIVTAAGTIDFARHEINALVIDTPAGPAIADAVQRMIAGPGLAARLAAGGAATMRAFDWDDYAARLLEITSLPRHGAYYRVPGLGLHGKWDPSTRLAGLDALLAVCDGTTLLDLGAAEGVVSAEFVRAGTRSVHGFELAKDRVDVAKKLLPPPHVVRQADLSQWDRFATQHADVLADAYDIVLFLGLYHHLPAATRRDTLASALARTRKWFAVRTPAALARTEDVVGACREHGFHLASEHVTADDESVGWLGIFEHEEAR